METQYETTASSTNWYDLKEPETTWLVDGLIPSDGYALICGKPKSGKSSVIRSLIASVIKKLHFLGRSIDIPTGTGRVLYIHLDRKDTPGRVAQELRELGITQEESSRLTFRTAGDIPEGLDERLAWLQKEVAEAKPHLLVIDLLWQFLDISNANDYKAVLDGINGLQDALRQAGYAGATLVAMHSRKAVNLDNPADDILGSTAHSGSFVTTIMLTRNRNDGFYTIMSDQTVRDEIYGEIEPSVISRNPDGSFALGPLLDELKETDALSRREGDRAKLLHFIHSNPGCDTTAIINGLKISKKVVLALIAEVQQLIRVEGEGKRGDPFRYFVHVLDETTAFVANFGTGGKQ